MGVATNFTVSKKMMDAYLEKNQYSEALTLAEKMNELLEG